MTARSFKVCLVGQSGVGKTTWLNRYMKGTFDPTITTSIESTSNKIVVKTNRRNVELYVWDIPGVISYRLNLDYMAPSIILAMYESGNYDSYVYVQKQASDIQSCHDAFCAKFNRKPKTIDVIYVANKSDITNDECINVIHDSAIDGRNTTDVFNAIVRSLCNDQNIRVIPGERSTRMEYLRGLLKDARESLDRIERELDSIQ